MKSHNLKKKKKENGTTVSLKGHAIYKEEKETNIQKSFYDQKHIHNKGK